ncbi:MAG: DUF92 domain-containing protein [Nitrososphaerota archaeon]|nr:DUF92 domain-containing protein [Nitrososphaerota archaeon]MDG7026055.1 DUF92 domain-containing protein [Nitrososphaerota archaeon]
MSYVYEVAPVNYFNLNEPERNAVLAGFAAALQQLSSAVVFHVRLDNMSVVVGFAVVYGGGFQWFVVVAVFFILGVAFTLYKYGYKRRIGTAQGKGGARNWPHILANGGVASVAAVWNLLSPSPAAAVVFLGAVSASAAEGVREGEDGPERLQAAAAAVVSTTVRSAIPVASLKTDSISMSVASLDGTLTLPNISSTVATSVGDIRAAKTKATRGSSPTTFQRTTPTTRAETRTPTVARRSAGR